MVLSLEHPDILPMNEDELRALATLVVRELQGSFAGALETTPGAPTGVTITCKASVHVMTNEAIAQAVESGERALEKLRAEFPDAPQKKREDN